MTGITSDSAGIVGTVKVKVYGERVYGWGD